MNSNEQPTELLLQEIRNIALEIQKRGEISGSFGGYGIYQGHKNISFHDHIDKGDDGFYVRIFSDGTISLHSERALKRHDIIDTSEIDLSLPGCDNLIQHAHMIVQTGYNEYLKETSEKDRADQIKQGVTGKIKDALD